MDAAYYTHYHTSTSAATTASLIEIELSLANCIYEYLHDRILNDINYRYLHITKTRMLWINNFIQFVKNNNATLQKIHKKVNIVQIFRRQIL